DQNVAVRMRMPHERAIHVQQSDSAERAMGDTQRGGHVQSPAPCSDAGVCHDYFLWHQGANGRLIRDKLRASGSGVQDHTVALYSRQDTGKAIWRQNAKISANAHEAMKVVTAPCGGSYLLIRKRGSCQ